jgi:undecaprenyl-diphosphatase
LFSEFLEYLNKLDGELILWIQHSLSSSSLDSFFSFITDLNKKRSFQLLIILPLILMWIYKERKTGLYKFLGLLMSLMIIDSFCGLIIKKIFTRPRPFQTYIEVIQKSPASGYSFVSNHAANMIGIAVYLGYFYPRWRAFWWIIALIVSFSRMYNGVHYFSDVLFGGLIGGLIGYSVARFLNKRFSLVKK